MTRHLDHVIGDVHPCILYVKHPRRLYVDVEGVLVVEVVFAWEGRDGVKAGGTESARHHGDAAEEGVAKRMYEENHVLAGRNCVVDL